MYGATTHEAMTLRAYGPLGPNGLAARARLAGAVAYGRGGAVLDCLESFIPAADVLDRRVTAANAGVRVRDQGPPPTERGEGIVRAPGTSDQP